MALHLSLEELRIVAGLLHRKISVTQIAIQLGRHRSTIHREIRRNFLHDPEVPLATGYWHINAQRLAAARRSRQRKLIRHDDLRLAVIKRLKDGWSPEQIAGRLRHEGHRPRVCHETICSSSIRKTVRSRSLVATCPSADENERRATLANHEALSFQSVA